MTAEGRARVVESRFGQPSLNFCRLEATVIHRTLRLESATGSPLTEVLHRFRARLNKTQADISRDAWLDESYVSRLFSGERTNPSRDALILMTVFGMGLSVEDTDEVLLAADYKPLALAQSIK